MGLPLSLRNKNSDIKWLVCTRVYRWRLAELNFHCLQEAHMENSRGLPHWVYTTTASIWWTKDFPREIQHKVATYFQRQSYEPYIVGRFRKERKHSSIYCFQFTKNNLSIVTQSDGQFSYKEYALTKRHYP